MVDSKTCWLALLVIALISIETEQTSWSAELDKNKIDVEGNDVEGNDAEQAKKRPASRSAKQSEAKQSEAKKKQTRRGLDKEVEKSVLRMVDDYLPEVKILLDKLRDKEPAQYEAAVRGMAKTTRRLQLAEKRGDNSLSLEVEVIKAVSAVNVLVAKLRIMDNPKDRKALQQATERVRKSELERAQHEFAVAQDRLKRLQQQVDAAKKRLDDQESNLDQKIEASFQANLRKAGLRK